MAHFVPYLFPVGQHDYWTAAYLPLGAGIPDLVVVAYNPRVFALANVDLSDAQILAYLRAVGRARLETIAERVGSPPKVISRRLETLVDAEAITRASNDLFVLSPIWRDILPEILTIEVKVSNWQRAVAQAARNRIFAHRSFVALPEKTAYRIRNEPVLGQLGIGVLAISQDDTVRVIRKPHRRRPSVWTYYYRLASLLARNFAN